jgi:hypothetical protein
MAVGLFGGLVNDVVPQSVIGRFFGLFRALSLIAGMLFNFYLLGTAQTAYVWIFVGFGVLYGAGFTLMCLMVKEGEYPPCVTVESAMESGFFFAAKTYFRESFGNPYYLCFFAASAFAGIAFGPVNLFSIFYATSVGMDTAIYGKCLALTYVISLVLAYPLGALADRFHPLRLCLMIMGLYLVISLWGGCFAHSVWTFGAALVAHGVIAGAYFTVSASLGQRLLPNARFAELSSAGGMLFSLLFIVLGPAMGCLLDHTGHNYVYTFFAGACLSFLALLLLIAVHRRFMALGGPGKYVAPKVTIEEVGRHHLCQRAI